MENSSHGCQFCRSAKFDRSRRVGSPKGLIRSISILGNPWGRPLNHPRLVQYLLALAIWIWPIRNGRHFVWSHVFCKSIHCFCQARSPSAYIIGLLMFSRRSPHWGWNGGNHDLLIFFLVAVALGCAGRLGVSLVMLGIAAAISFSCFCYFL